MSEIRVNNLQDTGGSNTSTPQQVFLGRSKAWVNFNGNGTVGIRRDYNVNSISDNGTGQYTINFSSSLNMTYCGVGAGGDMVGQTRKDLFVAVEPINSTSCRIWDGYPNGGLWDYGNNCLTFYTDN